MNPTRMFSTLTLAVLLASTTAHAQTLPPPQNVVSLSASASVEVTKDWLQVVFSTTRDGSDAAAVQGLLKQALDTALAEAKKGASPGQLEVQTGSFSMFPRYGAPTPRGTPVLTGWQGSAELIVEGRDSAAIAKLTSRITTLSIARVNFMLSREARQRVEGDVAAQAIQRFRERATAVSKEFGFAGYSVREVNVSSDGAQPQPMPLMRIQAANAMADSAPLPVEAGKAVVTATVNGSVQMK